MNYQKLTKPRSLLFLGMSGEKVPQLHAIPVLSQAQPEGLFCRKVAQPCESHRLHILRAIYWHLVCYQHIAHPHSLLTYRAGTELVLHLSAMLEGRTILEKSHKTSAGDLLESFLHQTPPCPACSEAGHGGMQRASHNCCVFLLHGV